MIARAVSLLSLLLLLTACGSDDASHDEPIVIAPSEGGETSGDDPAEDPAADPGEEATSEPGLVVGEDACTTDADCVPAACCHPSACVAQSNAPSCGDVMCTMDCQPGTMDCGGGCLCHEGRCAARVTDAPEPHLED